MVSKIMCQFVLFVISSGFHCTSQTLAAAAATASDVKICSVRAEIGKANNAAKKEGKRETGEEMWNELTLSRLSYVGTPRRRRWLSKTAAAAAAGLKIGLFIVPDASWLTLFAPTAKQSKDFTMGFGPRFVTSVQ